MNGEIYLVPTIKSVIPWYLYILETRYKHLYTGITTNWQRRFNEHNSNSSKCAKALKSKGPLTIKYCIELADRRTAMQAEIWLKKQHRSRKEAIVNLQIELPFDYIVVEIQKSVVPES